jgi:hypothetical protein
MVKATITPPYDEVVKSGLTPLMACIPPPRGIPPDPGTYAGWHCAGLNHAVCDPGPHGHGEVYWSGTSTIVLRACAVAGNNQTTTGYAQKHVYFVSKSAPAFQFEIMAMDLESPAPHGQTVGIVRVAQDPLGRLDPHFWRRMMYYLLRVVWDGRRPRVVNAGWAQSTPEVTEHDFEVVGSRLVLRRPVVVRLTLRDVPEERWARPHSVWGEADAPDEGTEWPAVIETMQAALDPDMAGSDD